MVDNNNNNNNSNVGNNLGVNSVNNTQNLKPKLNPIYDIKKENSQIDSTEISNQQNTDRNIHVDLDLDEYSKIMEQRHQKSMNTNSDVGADGREVEGNVGFVQKLIAFKEKVEGPFKIILFVIIAIFLIYMLYYIWVSLDYLMNFSM